MDQQIAAILLAAGDGKRMNSSHQKVCCELLGKPMLRWVLDACCKAGMKPEDTCVVLSSEPRGVCELLPDGCATAVQAERRGTGHAVRCALPFLQQAAARGIDAVAVLCGDAPLIDEAVLLDSLAFHRKGGFAVTALTANISDPGRYGRIVRENGRFVRIVEAADASEKELAIHEINAGAYWFSIGYLIDALPLLQDTNAQGEYYLTDLVGLASAQGKTAGAFCCPDDRVALGANSRRELAALNRIARDRILDRLYDQGVDIPLSDGVMIGPDVTVGRDTQILPGCQILGNTVIGEGCIIGPNTRIIDCTIGDNCTIDSSRLAESHVGSGVRIGPFAQLRPGCKIADTVKIGNFVEVKNSTVGEKTSFAHLTYIGDSDFGERINVGCGVVTVNYDGLHKHRTTVGDHAFIGCNVNLIAPVTVGEGAYVAAATTVTEDVRPDALAIGRIRQRQLAGWARGKTK